MGPVARTSFHKSKYNNTTSMQTNMEYNTYSNNDTKRNADPSLQFDRPCDSCKKRKIKCDYRLACFQCISRGLQCEYTAPPSKRKRKRSIENPPQQNPIKIDIEPQNNVIAHPHHEYIEKRVEENVVLPPGVPLAAKACGIEPGFCDSMLQVVQATTAAFYRLMKPLMPHTTVAYATEFSGLFYHRLFTTKIPDDLFAGSSVFNFEMMLQLLSQSSMFAIGSKLLHLDIKAAHFHRAAMAILELPAVKNLSVLDPESTKQFILSSIYSIFYMIFKKSYETIPSLWQRAADLLRINEKTLDPRIVEELTYTLIIIAPIQSCKDTDIWIRKLESFQGANITLELALFKELARIMAFLSRLSKLRTHEDARALNYLWKYAANAEKYFAIFYGSTHYQFYGVLVYGLKALAMINMPNNMEQEFDRCIQHVEQFYSNIIEPAERMWIKHQFEYLQVVFLNLQQEPDAWYTYDLTIGALESIMDVINANLSEVVQNQTTLTNGEL